MSADLETLIRLANWSIHHQHESIFDAVNETIKALFGENALSGKAAIEERKQFFDLIKVVSTFTYTGQDTFMTALKMFDDIHKRYNKVITDFAHVSPMKWFRLRKALLARVGLGILLNHLAIEDDMIDDNLEFLEQKNIWKCPVIDYKAYCQDIQDTFQNLAFYAEDDSDIDKEYEQKIKEQDDIFLEQGFQQFADILEKGKRRNQKVSIAKVSNLLSTYNLLDITRDLIEYLKDIESKIFHVPVLDIRYTRPDETSLLIENMREEDWSDEQANVEGPYRKDGRQSILSSVGKSIVSVGEKTSKGILSNSFSRATEIISPIKTSNDKTTFTKSKSDTHQATTSLKATVTAFVKKNDELDPLRVLETQTSKEKKKRKVSDYINDSDTNDEDDEYEPQQRKKYKVTRRIYDPIEDVGDEDNDFDEKSKSRISSLFDQNAKGTKVNFDDDTPFSSPSDKRVPVSASHAAKILADFSNAIPQKQQFPPSLESSPSTRPAKATSKEGVKSSRPRVKWTYEEEQALIRGVEQYGKLWSQIRSVYWELFKVNNRTSIDLKDKYRNIMKTRKEKQ